MLAIWRRTRFALKWGLVGLGAYTMTGALIMRNGWAVVAWIYLASIVRGAAVTD